MTGASNLWGGHEGDADVDREESETEYVRLLIEQIETAYPGASVSASVVAGEVSRGLRVEYAPADDEDLGGRIRDVVHEMGQHLWESGDWVVYAAAGEARS